MDSTRFTRTADGRVYADQWPTEQLIDRVLLDIADRSVLKQRTVDGEVRLIFRCANGTAIYRVIGAEPHDADLLRIVLVEGPALLATNGTH